MSRTVRDLPTIEMPEDYPARMPEFLAEMATRHGPIFKRDWSPQQSIVYMVGPDANRFVLQTHRDHFSHDQGWTPVIGEILGKGLLNMDDPLHAVHRKMMNPAFTISYMERYLPIMRRVIAERAATWVEREYVDLYAEARKITFDVAAETLVGFRSGPELDRLREMFTQVLVGDFDPATDTEESYWQRILGVAMETHQRLLGMIEERRRAPAGAGFNDILTTLVHARDDEGNALSDEQLLGHVNILLVAGHETSTALSSWLLYELATRPLWLGRVQAELRDVMGPDNTPLTLDQIKAMRTLHNVMTETGRLHPPAGNIPRGVVKPFEFSGYAIPVGTRVIYSIAASHLLPGVFAQPRVFDPDRFAPPREEDKRTPYGLVTFGGGPRICIGINFAQVEIKALAAHVLQQYALIPARDHPVEMHYYGPTGNIVTGIPMRVEPRVPVAK